MIGLLSRKADELRPFDDLLADDAFWEEFALEIERQLAPRMLVIFFAGAEAAARLRRPAKKTLEEKALPAEASDFISPEALAKLGEEAIREYVSPFAKQITQTTYDGVRDAVIRSRRDGTGVEGVISSIEPLFGPKRAELIAVTETTRLFGLGSQAIYRAQGYRVWEWRTAEDPWVDDQCAALNGQVFPIGNSFVPAHPRCRCWPTPAFELEQAEYRQLNMTKEESVEWGKKNFDSWNAKLSPAEKSALDAYGGGGYGSINEHLRGQEINEGSAALVAKRGQTVGEAAQNIQSALLKAEMPESIAVYREASFKVTPEEFRDLKPGATIADKGFMSTTLDSSRIDYGGQRDSFGFEIRVPKGYSGAYISAPYGFDNEQEVLLKAGTTLRVVEVTVLDRPNAWKVVAEVVQ